MTLDDALVRELDRRVGHRKRSAFIAQAVTEALGDARRWELIWSAVGAIADEGHDWDADSPALRPAEEDAARALFSGLRLAPLGDEEGQCARAWRRSFAASGITLAQADCLVAAAAAGIGASLATGNPKDFPMQGLAVEHWPAGA